MANNRRHGNSAIPIRGQPSVNATNWITLESTKLQEDLETTAFVVRLGMAFNALEAQRRAVQAVLDTIGGITGGRDVLAALSTAAALLAETLNVIRSGYQTTVALARVGGADDELIAKLGRILSGNYGGAALLGVIRNKLAFHWDEKLVSASLSQCLRQKTLIWAELNANELLYALSEDTANNALRLGLAAQEEATERDDLALLEIIFDAVEIVSDVIHAAVGGFLFIAGAEFHQRPT